MDSAIDTAAGQGLDEVVIGMPHRGRLNVLFNIVAKPLATIFNEFEGHIEPKAAGGSGDVKYHLGSEGTHLQMFGDGEIKVTLTANPSHLEAVNPVMEGIARAKQDMLDKGKSGYTVMPLLLHGDAAFAGLGIVPETINLAQLRGYTVGGTVHIVVNNQIGFTTTPIRAFEPLCNGLGEGIWLPRLPCQWRRSRSRRMGWQTRYRVSAAVRQGRLYRHDRLSTPRAQRSRRPINDPAQDV